jgi:hypothetical protein
MAAIRASRRTGRTRPSPRSTHRQTSNSHPCPGGLASGKDPNRVPRRVTYPAQEKQWPCSGVRARGAAGPTEYGESWIVSSPISSRCKPPSTGKTSEPVPRPALVFRICRRNLRGAGRCPMRAFKEMSGPPTFRSIRTTRTNAGSPTGRESYGDGGLVVVAGVTTCQGGRESRPQGEGGQVTGHHNAGRYA